ncbi:MAG: hypothetical protein ACFFEF_10640 [Candidatus Thorarchaeota archaeon]
MNQSVSINGYDLSPRDLSFLVFLILFAPHVVSIGWVNFPDARTSSYTFISLIGAISYSYGSTARDGSFSNFEILLPNSLHLIWSAFSLVTAVYIYRTLWNRVIGKTRTRVWPRILAAVFIIPAIFFGFFIYTLDGEAGASVFSFPILQLLVCAFVYSKSKKLS